MGWFTEQIEERKNQENELLQSAADELAEAITGEKSSTEYFSEGQLAQNALEEILTYYGCKGDSEVPKNVTEFLDRMEYMLHPHGIMWREVDLPKYWYRNAVGAVLVNRKDSGTPTALIPGKWGGYYYVDIKTGNREKLNRETAQKFENRGYCFYRPLPQRKLTLLDLLKYIFANISRGTNIMIYLMTLVLTLLGTLTPKITYFLYGEVVQSNNLRVLLSIATFAICVGISTTMFQLVKSLLDSRLNTQLNISVQAATMARIFSLPPEFFRESSSGELASKMQSINSFCSSIVTGVYSVGITSLFSLIYIFQIFNYARNLVIPAILITLVTVLYTIVVTVIRAKVTEELMHVSAKNFGLTYGLISGVQKLKLSGAEKRAFSKWMSAYAKESQLTYRPPKVVMYSSDISLAISTIGQFIMYYLAVKHSVSVAEYGAFTSAYGMVSGAFMALVGVTTTLASAKPILNIAKPIMNAVPETSEKKAMVSRLSGNIELNNVSFRYKEGQPNVINNLSLKIQKGQYVVIVGKTGCGKSTLVRLLLGFEKPNRGAIYYDGRDVSNMDLKSLRRSIGTVIQDGKLFSGDIYSNITIAAPEATLDDAWDAAEKVGLADDIREMPMGMHTLISEGGGGVSGGQRQRIMIARAIAPKPKILIFDEATSALDNITQKQVSNSLDALNCTRIVIAHRLSTIKQCDRIIFLEDGQIKEEGTYEELLALNGRFAEMVERQRLES